MSIGVLDLYRLLGRVDARSIARDPLLAWVGILPFVLALVYRLFVPWLREILLVRLAFDLLPYYPLIASSFITAAPGIVGMVAGFLLLDERDEGVTTAIAVTPVPPATYLAYRISAPLVAGALMTIVAYPMIGLVRLPLIDVIAAAAVASLLAPITGLFLAVFAQNKVSGFAMVKVLNTINIAPVVAWFIAAPWQWLAGVIPAYWPMKMLWLAANGETYVAYAVAGVGVSALWLTLLLPRLRSDSAHI